MICPFALEINISLLSCAHWKMYLRFNIWYFMYLKNNNIAYCSALVLELELGKWNRSLLFCVHLDRIYPYIHLTELNWSPSEILLLLRHFCFLFQRERFNLFSQIDMKESWSNTTGSQGCHIFYVIEVSELSTYSWNEKIIQSIIFNLWNIYLFHSTGTSPWI